MSDADHDERAMRLELMRLDKKLKLTDLRLLEQRAAFQPVKLLLLGFTAGLVFVVILVAFAQL